MDSETVELLSLRQAADRYGESIKTLYTACHNTRLRYRKINGKIVVTDEYMREWFETRKTRRPCSPELKIDKI